jgi:hypothetical protein
MKRFYPALFFFLGWLFTSFNLYSQDHKIFPKFTGHGEFIGITPPLGDLPVLSADEYAVMKSKADLKLLNPKLRTRAYPFADIASPKGPDPAWQSFMGSLDAPGAPILNFEGQASPYYPPDANGAVGPGHYMQTINTTYAIYNKSGALVAGPTAMNQLFSGVPGSNCNNGDPLILYDEQAGRWLAVEFSLCGATDYMLVAVSTTSDPAGTWYKYSFDVADMPDYEKFGIWQDGYYMGDNNDSGKDIYVFERSQMLIGGAAPQMVGFDNPWRPTTIDGFVCVPPVDNDGAFAPAGSPGLFIAFNDDAIGGGSDQLWIYELAVNWTTPASSTFTRSQQLAVPSFDSNFGNTWNNIPQLGTTQKLDAIPQVIMNIPQYRNFGSYQTLVCCHTVDVDATNHAGVRWYELRKTTGAWTVRQSGTYAPDAHSRWMGSIVLNGSGQLGLGYSVSSSAMNPAIRYCGQSSGAYASASGILDIAEEVIQVGSNSQTGYNRWGDYSCMALDPSDDKTFWFTTEYIGSGGSRKTKIAAFRFGSSPTVVTLAATALTGTGATLNGTVNPNGLETNWHFEYGTTTGYGSATPVTPAGSGSSDVTVSADIAALAGGIPYHFRLVGTNADGTTPGNDLTFTLEAAAVTTTPASDIGFTTATAGGNVTSGGGSTVIARGLCWSTTANPDISGLHTTDGSGTGIFTSSLTGLLSNTTYHIRAYATNGTGTFYGGELTFVTLCGTGSIPFTENFNNELFPVCLTEQISGTGTVNSWSVSASSNAGGIANELMSMHQNINPGITRLVTPALYTPGLSWLNLSFRHMLDASGTGAILKVQSSSDGINWTDEAWQVATTSTDINATMVNTTISSNLNSASTYVAFTISGDLNQYNHWYIDDILITSCINLPVSVSIDASANPVCAGTGVTFTATPTNGGTTPSYQWMVNGSNAGSNSPVFTCIPANGDQALCILTSDATCAVGNPATSNAITMTVNPILQPVITGNANPCAGTQTQVYLTEPGMVTYSWAVSSGGLITAGGTPFDHNVTVTWNTTGPQSVTAGYTDQNGCISLLTIYPIEVHPAPFMHVASPNGGEDWLQGSDHTIEWSSNAGENLKIELYKGGILNQVLTASTPSSGSFVWAVPAGQQPGSDYRVKITSLSACPVSDSSDNDFRVSSIIPDSAVVQNVSIPDGQTMCYNALQTVSVAGNGTTFLVQPGGMATMIAGLKIVYQPGTTVQDGGYMHGYITAGNNYCGIRAPPVPDVDTEETGITLITGELSFKTFPNPTDGKFVIEFNEAPSNTWAEIYSMQGEIIVIHDFMGQRRYEFNLEGYPAGVYFLRIILGNRVETVKVVKL